jgi:PKHD-type hydroxylase
MSAYQFAPCPDLSTREEIFATWENGFTDQDIKSIIDIGEKYCKTEAKVGGQQDGQDISKIRKSEVSWINLNNETNWLYDKLAYIARQLNGQFFDYNLYGFVEDFQYTVYRPEGDHYTWHMDKGPNNGAPRKLSLVLQLSDPSDYDGGDLEIFTGAEPIKMEKRKGLIVTFPGYIIHRVTPVTRGTRRSLVVWIAGPKFR